MQNHHINPSTCSTSDRTERRDARRRGRTFLHPSRSYGHFGQTEAISSLVTTFQSVFQKAGHRGGRQQVRQTEASGSWDPSDTPRCHANRRSVCSYITAHAVTSLLYADLHLLAEQNETPPLFLSGDLRTSSRTEDIFG